MGGERWCVGGGWGDVGTQFPLNFAQLKNVFKKCILKTIQAGIMKGHRESGDADSNLDHHVQAM